MRSAHRWLTVLVLMVMAAPAFGQRNRLSVGDAAPGLDIDEWVVGQEVSITGGQVFVVVFWATTSAPSKAAMPHLSELQDRFGDQGLIVVAISAEDGGADLVRPYVIAQGKKMGFIVGVDRRRSTSRAWPKAAGMDDLPVAFIVDRKSKVAFIGDPRPKRDSGIELVRILEKVLRGRFDPVLEESAKPTLKSARSHRKSRTWRMAMKQYDEVIDLSPTIFADVALERFEMMLVDMNDAKAAYLYARETLVEDFFASDQEGLRMLAEKIATNPRIDPAARDLDLAILAARAAVTLTGEGVPDSQATLALIHFHRGEIHDAIRRQKKAWMMARPRSKAELKTVLKSYQEAAGREAVSGLKKGG